MPILDTLQPERSDGPLYGYFEQTRHDEVLRVPCEHFCGREGCVNACKMIREET